MYDNSNGEKNEASKMYVVALTEKILKGNILNWIVKSTHLIRQPTSTKGE